MTPHEERRIIEWNKELSNNIELVLNKTKDRRSEKLRDFCNDLSGLAHKVSIVEQVLDSSEYPSIEIGNNIRYLAVPTGSALEPFLLAAAMTNDDQVFVPKSICEMAEKADKPAALSIFISSQCPHCPESVRQLIPLTSINKNISLEVIDGTLFNELAQREKIQCLPTVLYGDDFRWTGVTSLEDIAEVISGRGASTLSVQAMERMLQEGNASGLARMMVENGEIPSGFVDLLINETFYTRLGAMAAIDAVVKNDRGLVAEIISPIWERFDDAIEPMQIDLLYILGDAGTEETVLILESVVNGDHRDHVKEAAMEAIETIRDRDSRN